MRALLAAALALTALPALGQDRPSEEELFGRHWKKYGK